MGLRVTVLMIGNDCHEDRNTYGLGYSYLMFISKIWKNRQKCKKLH